MALNAADTERIAAAVNRVERHGPSLGRPFVDSIKGSRHHNMKELRSCGGHLRALFAFDPRRRAVVLVGGDKTGDWRGWYARNISRADRLYDRHLRDLGKEQPWRTRKPPGRRFDDRSR
ncbi:MAG: type II toxin-antitoxin system RelE/ParE family toxin [Actinomycetota bacterium]|nr:type II toxin-antitoxin system RelE/ParE family toxin [Actinomycetota bacterium]